MSHLRAIPSLLLVIALATLGCEESDGPSTPIDTAVRIPERVDFAPTYIGLLARASLALQNAGAATATVEVLSVTPPFLVNTPRLNIEVPGLRESTLELSVRPQVVGSAAGTLSLRVDGRAVTVALEVVGVERPQCDDDNPCTDDRFDADTAACDFVPREGPCDDDSACTKNDTCLGGRCVGESIVCEDDVECTFDTCIPAVGCVFTPENTRCDDGDPCLDDVCDATLGCLSEVAEDFSPCGSVVECVSAQVCRNGACIDLAIPDGAPCGTSGFCPSPGTCSAGSCTAGATTTLRHEHVGRRDFISAAATLDGFQDVAFTARAVTTGDHLWVLKDGMVSVARVQPHGFDVLARRGADQDLMGLVSNEVNAVVAYDDHGAILSASVESEDGFVSAFHEVTPPLGTLTGIFPFRDGRLRFCIEEAPEVLFSVDDFSVANAAVAELASSLCAQRPRQRVFASDRFWVVRLVDDEPELALYDSEGIEIAVAPLPRNGRPRTSAAVGNEAVFFWRKETLDDPRPTVLVAKSDPGGISPVLHAQIAPDNSLGSVGRRLYWIDDGALLTTVVRDDGSMSLPETANPNVDRAIVLGETLSRQLVSIREGTGEIRILGFARTPADALGPLLPDGFALTLRSFDLDSDGILTVFAEESTRLGDVASLTSAPVNPLLRAFPPPRADRPAATFVDGHLTAIRNSPPDFGRVPVFELQELVEGVPLVTTGAYAPEAVFALQAIDSGPEPSVRGLTYDPVSRELIAYPLLLPSVSQNALSGVSSSVGFVSLPAANPRRTALTVHPNNFFTIAVDERVALVQHTDTLQTVTAFVSPNVQTLVYAHVDAFFDGQVWAVLFSGGPPLGGAPEGEEPWLVYSDDLVTLRSELLEDVLLGSGPKTRARLLGFADGLFYVGRLRQWGDDSAPSLHVFQLEADGLRRVEVIPLEDEALQMKVLADGRRMVADERGFSFFSPQCVP